MPGAMGLPLRRVQLLFRGAIRLAGAELHPRPPHTRVVTRTGGLPGETSRGSSATLPYLPRHDPPWPRPGVDDGRTQEATRPGLAADVNRQRARGSRVAGHSRLASPSAVVLGNDHPRPRSYAGTLPQHANSHNGAGHLRHSLSADVQRDDGGVVGGEDAGVGKGPAGCVPAGPWCAWCRPGGQSDVTSVAAVRALDSSTMALRLA